MLPESGQLRYEPDHARQAGSGACASSVREGVEIELTALQVMALVRANGGVACLVPGGQGASRLRVIVERELGSQGLRLSRSLLIGLLVMTALPTDGSSIGVVELARGLELSSSTTHRYLLTLIAAGVAERDPASRRYRASKGVWD